MMVPEDLTGTIVSMTSQALYGTMTMANSALYWVSSVTPSVSETFKVGASMFGKYVFGNETPTPSGMGASAEAGAAFYYYNAMETIISLLTIWILFKTFSLVWRSVAVVWQITVGICKILKFLASKIGLFTNGWGATRFFRYEQPQDDETDTLFDDGRNSTTIDPPTPTLAAAPQSNANPSAKMQGYSFPSPEQQSFVQSQFPPPSPIGGVWYYHTGVTQNGHWLPPPTYAPLPAAATMDHRNGFQPQNSVFVPVPQPPVFEITQQNANSNSTNVENNEDSTMGNVQNQRPPHRVAAPNETCDYGNNTTSDTAMRIVEEKTVANESNTVDEATTNVSVGANATKTNAIGAYATNNNGAAQESPPNSKKRKSPPESDECASDDNSMQSDDDSSMQSAESSESEGRPSKKQRREEATESDAELANQLRALKKRSPSIDCDPETPEDMIQHLEVNAARNDDLDEEEEIFE